MSPVLEVGRPAEVGVSVATLWSRPDVVRPVDAPALCRRPDIRAWVAGLDADQKLGRGVLSQLLLGERVQVERIDDGWARVVAVEQPAGKLDPRGYPGWLPVAHLTAAENTARHHGAENTAPVIRMVAATVTDLRDAPDGAVVLPGVILGTRLVVAGPPDRGWLPVRVTGVAGRLWVRVHDIGSGTGCPETPGRALDVAARLLGVAYVWGGVSAYGIDCSGLVHLAWRRYGVRLPRDADDQAAATTPVPLGEERPGDLYFFAHPGRHIHHTGFVAAYPAGGKRCMLHACSRQRRVVREPVRGERAATLVAAHRVQPTA